MQTQNDSTPLRDRAWGVLKQLAAAERERNTTLTEAQGIVKAMQTEMGRAAVQLYRHPLAHQNAAEVAAHDAMIAKRRAAGFTTWTEAVDTTPS